MSVVGGRVFVEGCLAQCKLEDCARRISRIGILVFVSDRSPFGIKFVNKVMGLNIYSR